MLAAVWAWLKAHLTNSWMASAEWCAQSAHFFFAAWLVLTVELFRPAWVWWVVGVGLLVVAPLKEYAFDLWFEEPPQSLSSQVLDHDMYGIGAAAGLWLLWLAGRLP